MLIGFKQVFVLTFLIYLGQTRPILKEIKQLHYKHGQVVFLGDSITAFWNNEGRSVWDKHYEPIGAVNTGVPGWTTQQVIDGINTGIIDNLDSYLATLMIGVNDLWTNVQSEVVIENIRIILDLIKVKNPSARILLLGILPPGFTGLHEKCRLVNEAIKKFADEKTIFFLNMEQEFATGLGQVREEFFLTDRVHLSEKGYEHWHQTMAPLFNSDLNLPFPGKVVWMGDSLSNRWKSVGSTLWNQHYRDLETLNFGKEGHTTRDTLNLIENEKVLDGLNPKVTVLMIGGNDLLQGSKAPEIVARIDRILEHFRAKFSHSRILLLGLLPGRVPTPILEEGKIINAALEAKHNGDDLIYLDMREQFADANDQIYPDLYEFDGIHLTLKGYQMWHSTMWPVFEPLLGFV